jgi:hypothetical protein
MPKENRLTAVPLELLQAVARQLVEAEACFTTRLGQSSVLHPDGELEEWQTKLTDLQLVATRVAGWIKAGEDTNGRPSAPASTEAPTSR